MEPHHAPRHARKRGGRWLLPALGGQRLRGFPAVPAAPT